MKNHSLSFLRFSSRRGQSIVEAMVALSVLMLGLMGVLTLLSRSLFLARVASDQAKATYLASEGIEIAKSLIDHNVYSGIAAGSSAESSGWAGSLSGSCFGFSTGGSNYYDLDFRTYGCPQPAGSDPDPLYLFTDPSTGVGMYYDSADLPTGATLTNFSRVVKVSRPSDNEMDVQSTVTWSTGVLTGQSLVLEDHFYNWHP
jgi:type II secretory pathway pseudopilin PulG